MQRILLALIMIIFLVVSCKLKEEPTEPVDPDEDDLILVFPNGNDSLMVGANYDILWASTLQSTLVLEYSTDNGSTWKTISDSVSNTGSYTWGPVPDSRSSKCLMRVRTPNGSSSDQSDGNWSIIENVNKVLILTAPSGGIVLQQGSSLDIAWISSKITTVKIEFSSNNGNTWETIVTNFDASKGKYTWEKIPAINSAQCLIRISDVSSPTVSDVMPTTFSIVIDINLMVLSPNGGEELEAGTDHEIRWYSRDIATVKLEYSINNGLSWSTIVNNLTNTGLYLWEPIPSTPTTLAKIKITDVDNPANVDQSDTTFSILPEASITILSPASGDKWQSGTVQNIVWNSKNVANVKIEYSINNGATWTQIATSVPSNGSYAWSVPVHNSSLCNIKISDASDGRPSNIMNQPFTIYTGEDVLEVYSPNGGESWEIGTNQEIKWFAFGVTSLKIEYTTNNGQSWINIANSVPNIGTYNWKSIPNTPTSLAKVKISDASDGIPFDESNGTFTISQESQIQVLEPNGGEQLQAGTSTNIRWTSTNVENVHIEITTNNGANWTTIVRSTPSIGFYVWENIPDVSSQQCRIRVSDASDGIPSDISDGNFTITNQVVQTLIVTSPNGGEIWQSGVSELITWQSSGIDSVKIEYSLNNGTTWIVIAESVENADAYTWNPIPSVDDFKRSCKVRVSDAVDGKPMDESNGTFTIKPIPSITLLTPNGGEEFTAGESFDITWTSIGIEKITIESTSNNGVKWDTVAASINNTGTYSTEFAIPSTEYKVRVKEASTGSPVDASDGTFTILPKITKSITVVRPNGGENWLTSKDPNNPNYHEIRWESNNVEKVDIQYSLNGGATWNNIVFGIPSNGLYNWRVPENIQFRTDLAKIRIRETNNENLFDDTDGFFSIHPQVKLLRIEQPLGDEYYFCPDDPCEDLFNLVTWTSAGISHVKIEYTSDNGATWETFEEQYPSSGAYPIPIPLVGQCVFDVDSNFVFIPDLPTSQARIRITDATPIGVPYVPVADPTIVDVSEQFNLGICPLSSKVGLKPNNEIIGRKE
ncbi:hypothetical protein ASZ90_004677 [hydrocarbon metagenome]|uniref:Uncharacterized protein n=1 Tax=hydrocarbon metagenome TaxID=938273 RepID=A0A0W8FXT3_9ZZZZ